MDERLLLRQRRKRILCRIMDFFGTWKVIENFLKKMLTGKHMVPYNSTCVTESQAFRNEQVKQLSYLRV